MRDGWRVCTLAELSAGDVLDIMELRSVVFVVEQDCVYQDPGDEDRHMETRHQMLRNAKGELIAYARLLPPGLDGAEPAIGRVICAAGERGRGLGHELMECAIEWVERLWPAMSIRLHAQTYLLDFYGRHGFVAQGEPYLLDGLDHQEMLRLAPGGSSR